MSNVDRKTRKRTKPFQWIVPAKRKPLFPPPDSNASAIVDPDARPVKPCPVPSHSSPDSRSQRIVKQGAGITPKTATRTKSITHSKSKPRLKSKLPPQSKINSGSNQTTVGRGGYFDVAKRPLVSLYFLLPLILCYEIAKIFAGVDQLSSGIDLWVHDLLCVLGAGQLVILPLLTTVVLLFYHHRAGDDWHVRPSTFLKMVGESLGIGVMLFCFANLFQIAAVASPNAGQLIDPYYWQIGSGRWWGNVITYVGTGIHEELIFRVILMLPAIVAMKKLFADNLPEAPPVSGTLVAVMGIGLLFAAAHVDVVNAWGESFDAVRFVFRCLASCIFSAVFLYRGFGIVVGTHIAYNVLTLFA